MSKVPANALGPHILMAPAVRGALLFGPAGPKKGSKIIDPDRIDSRREGLAGQTRLVWIACS